jgi:hypothetical protein
MWGRGPAQRKKKKKNSIGNSILGFFMEIKFTFLKSVRKDGFFIPHWPILKKKSIHLFEGTRNTF